MVSRRIFRLDEVGNVEGHLVDLGVVEGLDFSEHFGVVGSDKVDCDTGISKHPRPQQSTHPFLPNRPPRPIRWM